MATETLLQTITLVVCPTTKCGVTFGVTTSFEKFRREDHETFCCPWGHRQFYPGKSDLEKAQAALAAEKQRRGWAETRELATRDQLETANRRAAAQKGQVTRIRNLIARGICPVSGCRRNFDNVREHMATQHPEFHTHDGGVA